MDQRHAHVRRDQRGGEFDIGREDVAFAVGVRVLRLVDQVRRLSAQQIGVADGAVDAAVAVIQLAFGTQLDAGGDADRTGGQLEDVRTRDAEVPHAQLGLGPADHVHADAVQGRLVRPGVVTDLGVGQRAAVEEVVGVRRRLGRPLLQLGGGDVVRNVLGGSFRPGQGGFPVPAVPVAAQAAQDAVLLVDHVDADRTHIHEAVAGQGQVLVAVQRVVVVGAGDDEGHGRGGRDRFLPGLGFGMIAAQLAEGFDGVVDLVLAGHEQVEPVDFRHHRQAQLGHVGVQVRGQVGAAHDAQSIADRGGAVSVRARQDGEGAVGRAVDGRAVAANGETAPRGQRRGAAQAAVVFKAGALEQRAQVVGGGELLVERVQLVAMVIVEEGRDVAATVLNVLAAIDRQVQVAQAGALGAAVLGRDRQAVHVVAQDGVDHAGHGVGAIDGGGAVTQDFHALQTRHRNGVGVVGQDRHQMLVGLRRRVADDATAVQQHQGVADAQAAQVHRAGVAARRVRGVGQVGRVEGHIAHLRDGAEQVVA